MNDKWEPTLDAQREIAIRSDAPLEIVFLPGLLCTEQLWAAQIEGLKDIAHATVARLDNASNMEALASSALNQAPSGAFMLVGMSMGGYVAFEIMRQQPQRVLGLALLSTSARPDMPETIEARRAQMRLSGHDLGTVVDQLLPKLLHPSRQHDADCTGVVRSMAKTLGADVFKRQQEAIIGRPDSRPNLHEINCPTLVLCGREDPITPPEVHSEIAEVIPGSHLVIMDNCGHLSPLEQPEQVTRELRSWLTETQSAYAMR